MAELENVEEAKKVKKKSVKAMLADEPKKKVRIHRGANDKGDDFVPVSINGYIVQVKKGVDVEVPESVYDILVKSEYI